MPRGVEPSNLGKVFWPQAGLRKGDLLDYLDAVSTFILPALRNRPLTVIRFPDGIEKGSFYQKQTPGYAPSWVATVSIPSGGKRKQVDYTVCNMKRTLLWLGNQAAIEFHPWLSRIDRLERPDHLVLDIDPPEGDFPRAVEVALLFREVLDERGLHGACKTSGSKGVHVFVPVQRRYHYGRVRAAAEELAATVAARAPGLATTEFRKAGRAGRVFLDTGRIAPGAHIVAPYSPRARPAASVSFPVEWKDLPSVRPQDFTIRNVPGHLARRGDLWRSLMPKPQALGDLGRDRSGR